MADNAEQSTVMSDLSSSQNFINHSQIIQQQINANMSFSNMLPTHSELVEEELAKEELPRFGNAPFGEIKFQDPLEKDHQEITNMLQKIEMTRPAPQA